MGIIETLLNSKDLINLICNILVSIGTVGAVIVSLYFSYRSNNPKPNIKIKASARIREDFNHVTNEYEEIGRYALIEVYNLGVLPIEINCFFWQIGFLNKKNFYQHPSAFDRHISSEHHAILHYGQDANYYIDLQTFLEGIKAEFEGCKYYFLKWLKLKFYYIVVKSNVGNKYRARIDNSLQQEILKAIIQI